VKVFLTGATGFLGSVLAKQLVERGFDIRAIRRPNSSLDLIQPVIDHIEWIEGDVSNYDSLAEGMQGTDGVFHCAAFLGFDGKRNTSQLHEVNVQGTANVVNAALETGISRLLHVSSIAALGRHEIQDQHLDETAEWKPSKMNTDYAVSKHHAEMEVQRGVGEGLDAVLVNPALVMGPGRKGENTMQIAEKLLSRSIPVLPTGGTNVVDVQDVAAGAISAFERGRTGERYLLAGHNMAWSEILGVLSDLLSVKPPTRRVNRTTLMVLATMFEVVGAITRTQPLVNRETARLSTSLSYYNNAKAVNELGCTFRPFSETAKRIAEAALSC